MSALESPDMPSDADRVRRHSEEAPPVTESREAVSRPLSDLARYAGWLARDHVSVAVRAGAHALTAAIDAGADTSQLLLTLHTDVGRLPGGDLRKMLRKALAEIRVALAPGGIDV